MLESTSADNIVLMGDSAGGGHALGLALLLKERDLPQPGTMIMISPWVDVTMSNPEISEDLQKKDKVLERTSLIEAGMLWAAGEDPEHYLISPVYGDLRDLPPITTFAGTYEIFYPHILKFQDKLQKAGNQG